jgi:dihydrofolate reductase
MAINVSIDGYADHTLAIPDDELHEFFANQLDETGIELFGRVTYEMMANFWPQVREDSEESKSTLKFADRFNAIPKVVFSSTLEKAEWNNTTLVTSDAIEYVTKLKATEGKNLFVGGIKLANSFMSKGLIDEYWLVVHPVLAGKGRRLFEVEQEKSKLRLAESRVFKSGAVVLHYVADN